MKYETCVFPLFVTGWNLLVKTDILISRLVASNYRCNSSVDNFTLDMLCNNNIKQ